MSDGFLERWSRRKLDAKLGKAREAAEPEDRGGTSDAAAAGDAGATPNPATLAGSVPIEHVAEHASAPPQAARQAPVQPAPIASPDVPSAPTLADVQALHFESDFSRFAASNVAPDVKNAALKKLFADPRYNVMDGMDVYVDDYSKSESIAPALLRQLASARFLGLFEQEERDEAEAARQARDVADNPTSQLVAKSHPTPKEIPEPDHADPDLRLQQDHAAPGEDPGRGVG